MSVTLADLEPFLEKDVILHIKLDGGDLAEVEATLRQATVAGVVYKEKGKPNLQFVPSVDQIEEIALAPTKAKPVTQKKLKPIELGAARQHLVDRHGVQLSWGKTNDEKAAFDYHAGLDHSDLGHIHVEPEKKDERDEALADETPAQGQPANVPDEF